METEDEHGSGRFDGTVPSQIADLDVEVQAMFERVRVRLGMRAGGPEMVGRYELRDWIARGGMGQVYRAYDVELEREVALKQIAPRPGIDPELLRKRLRREAQLLAKVVHDNVVRVYDVGVHRDLVFIVMELIEGPTMRGLQTAGQLSTLECLRLYAQAGRGLLAAHERGVIHRDFKPDNVFVDGSGRARVGDFGLAHVLGEELRAASEEHRDPLPADVLTNLTQSGEVLGTLGYMAPEQLRGEAADASADQFGFCVSLWEALTGERPFAGVSTSTRLAAMEQGPAGGADIDARLLRALRTGLAPTPEARHPSMGSLIEALEELHGRPERRRRRFALGTGAVLAVALGVSLTVAGLMVIREQEQESQDTCDLEHEVAELEAQYDSLLPEASPRTTAALRPVPKWLKQMKSEATSACVIEDPNQRVLREQHVESLITSMGSLLYTVERGSTQEVLGEHLDRFDQQLARRASVPMTLEGYETLSIDLDPLELRGEREQYVETCAALEPEFAAGPTVDYAELLLRCAWITSLVGPDYEGVVQSYKRARGLARDIDDGQRHLQATLGAAKTTIMRVQNYERGDELLDMARDELDALGIPGRDIRYANYLELRAILARERDDFDESNALHVLAIGSHIVTRRSSLFQAALTNFGNALYAQGQLNRARRIYRFAMEFDPLDPEPRVSFGCALANDSDPEARAILEPVLNMDDHDLELNATLCLLTSTLDDDTPATNARSQELRDRLEAMLLTPDEFPRTPKLARESWTAVAVAYLYLDDDSGYQRARAHLSKEDLEALDAAIAGSKAPDDLPHDPEPTDNP